MDLTKVYTKENGIEIEEIICMGMFPGTFAVRHTSPLFHYSLCVPSFAKGNKELSTNNPKVLMLFFFHFFLDNLTIINQD